MKTNKTPRTIELERNRRIQEATKAREIIAKTIIKVNNGIYPIEVKDARYDIYGAYKAEIIGETDLYYIRKNDCKVLKNQTKENK